MHWTRRGPPWSEQLVPDQSEARTQHQVQRHLGLGESLLFSPVPYIVCAKVQHAPTVEGTRPTQTQEADDPVHLSH